MDGSQLSPVQAAIASVVMPLGLERLRSEIGEHDRAAEAALELIRSIEGEPDGAPRREDRLRQARIDRLKALDAASQARVRAAPLLHEHRAALVKALSPMADRITAELCERLDALVVEIAPLIAEHNALVGAINRRGGAALSLPSPALPHQFAMLVRSLTAYGESRAKAAAPRPRGMFGRRR